MKKSLIFMMLFILCFSFMAVPSFAMEIDGITVPDYPTAEYGNAQYYFVQSDKSIYVLNVYSSDEPYNITHSVYKEFDAPAKNSMQVFTDIPVHVRSYKWIKGTSSFEKLTGQTTSQHYTDCIALIDSTHDVYDKDGELFFQVPPATLEAKIMEMVAKVIPTTQTTIQQTMMTILLCGVGCLALVISLVLLVKVLRRYLPR